jgi:NAD(P)-dependent dehydrogenase (short-subunit alcohol dehydrogenase family)
VNCAPGSDLPPCATPPGYGHETSLEDGVSHVAWSGPSRTPTLASCRAPRAWPGLTAGGAGWHTRTMGRASGQSRRVALVTGASAGIGRATADLLAAQGWTVVGASRRGTGGEGWTGLVMDVDSDESVRAGVQRVLADHGRVEALVACAGWGLSGPVETTTMDEARAQVETIFWGCVRVTAALLPVMRRNGSGRIVLLSSIGGLIAIPFQAYYSAGKFALEGFAEATAYEVAPFGVHVTLVEPGNVRTDFTANRRRAAAAPGPYGQAMNRAVGLMERDERTGADPVEVARTVAGVLAADHPRRRVSVGKAGERVGLVAKRVLPHRWFEAVAKGSLGVE